VLIAKISGVARVTISFQTKHTGVREANVLEQRQTASLTSAHELELQSLFELRLTET